MKADVKKIPWALLKTVLLLCLLAPWLAALLPAHAAGMGVNVGGVAVADPAGNSTVSGNSGTGWSWDGTVTPPELTLESTYDGAPIDITCDASYTVKFVCTGDVTIDTTAENAVQCGGNLTFEGGGNTLALKGTDTAATLYVVGNLLVSNGNIAASVDSPNYAAIYVNGDMEIAGTGNVTADNSNSSGLSLYCRELTVEDNATLENKTGQIAIGGDISNAGRIVNKGSFRVATSKTCTIESSGNFDNEGTFDNSGTIANSGTITNFSSGMIGNFSGGAINNNGTVANSGTINNNSSAMVTNNSNGTITNNGTVTNNGTIDNSGTVTNSGTVANNGTIGNDGTIDGSGMMNGTPMASYCTVKFHVIDEGAASGSTISATYNNTPIVSRTPVVKGQALVITAVGVGADSYAYAWSGSGTSGQFTAAITIASLNAEVDATCTVTGTNTVGSPTTLVTGVFLNRITLPLTTGDTSTLSVTIAPANATNKNVTWSSSNEAVATVDETGKVTAVGPGTCTITATTADGNKTAACEVTVTTFTAIPVTGVTVAPTSLVLKVGQTSTLAATVAPANATDKKITWSSGSPATATVDGTGKVTAVAVGTASIAVKTENRDYTATCMVTVTDTEILVDLSDLKLENGVLKLQPGEEVDVTIGVTPEGTKFKATGLPEGLTLTEDGRLYGKVPTEGTHTVIVTATAPDGTEVTATFTVEVKDGEVIVKQSGSSSGGCNAGGLGAYGAAMVVCGVFALRRRGGKGR